MMLSKLITASCKIQLLTGILLKNSSEVASEAIGRIFGEFSPYSQEALEPDHRFIIDEIIGMSGRILLSYWYEVVT